jgi:hypothetical protein
MASTNRPNGPAGPYQQRPSQPQGWGPAPPQAQWPAPAPTPAPVPPHGQWPAQPQQPYGWAQPPGYPQPAAWPGHEPQEQPPTAATLLAVTVWRLGIGGAALGFAATGAEETMSTESLSYLSNVGTGIGFLALAAYPVLVGGRRHEPRSGWLRGALTVMMLLVAGVFVIGMGGDPDGPHAVIPALVLLDWLFVGRNQFQTRGWEPPTWIAFPLAYLLYHQANDVPLYEDILGEDQIGTMVPALLAGTVVLAYLLLGAALIRRSMSGSAAPRADRGPGR